LPELGELEAPGRVTNAGQVKQEWSDRERSTGPPSLGVGCGVGNPTLKQAMLQKCYKN